MNPYNWSHALIPFFMPSQRSLRHIHFVSPSVKKLPFIPEERGLFGVSFTPLPSRIDPRGTHLVYRDEPDWSKRLRVLARPLESSLAWGLFLYEIEYAAYAHLLYGHGSVSWDDFLRVYADVECASLLLGAFIRLTNYADEGVELALAEMRQSKRPWLPILAECLANGQDYSLLAYQAFLFIHRKGG